MAPPATPDPRASARRDLRHVALLAPMPNELAPLRRALRLRRTRVGGISVWRGHLGPVSVTARRTGIGLPAAEAATAWVLEQEVPDHVVVVGVAGGLDPALGIGDLVVPAIVRDAATGREHRATALGPIEPHGTIVSSNEPFDHLEARAGAAAIDMETSAVAAVCDEAGVPWTAFRALSDLVREDSVDEAVMGLARPDGSPDLGAVLRYVAADPRRVKALAKLNRDATAATTAAAAAAISAIASSR